MFKMQRLQGNVDKNDFMESDNKKLEFMSCKDSPDPGKIMPGNK